MSASPAPATASIIAGQVQEDASKDLEAQLDNQILHIRNEINKLRAQKQRLSSALLGSNRVQKQLFARKKQTIPPSEVDTALDSKLTELEAKIDREREFNDIKIHRLAFGVTSFPFSDDAPERRGADGQSQTMLGLRFDLHPTRAELVAQQKPQSISDSSPPIEEEDNHIDDEEITTYFLVLRKLHHHNKLYLKIHQHSIPSHIDVDILAQKYLPLPEALLTDSNDALSSADSFQDDSGIDLTQDIADPDHSTNLTPQSTNPVSNTGQDLHAFTRTLHGHLRAWHYRVQSVFLVRQAIQAQPELRIQDLRCTNDGRQVTVAWNGDELALLKVGYDGWIEAVVAYGNANVLESEDESEERGSDKDEDEDKERLENVRLYTVERKLTRTEAGEKVRISDLVARLSIVEKYLSRND